MSRTGALPPRPIFRSRPISPILSQVILLLILVGLAFEVVLPLASAYPTDLAVEDALRGCNPETCADPSNDSFFSYHECCGSDCCQKYRFWVIPGSIAAVGFIGGAFFALCFQCR